MQKISSSNTPSFRREYQLTRFRKHYYLKNSISSSESLLILPRLIFLHFCNKGLKKYDKKYHSHHCNFIETEGKFYVRGGEITTFEVDIM